MLQRFRKASCKMLSAGRKTLCAGARRLVWKRYALVRPAVLIRGVDTQVSIRCIMRGTGLISMADNIISRCPVQRLLFYSSMFRRGLTFTLHPLPLMDPSGYIGERSTTVLVSSAAWGHAMALRIGSSDQLFCSFYVAKLEKVKMYQWRITLDGIPPTVFHYRSPWF